MQITVFVPEYLGILHFSRTPNPRAEIDFDADCHEATKPPGPGTCVPYRAVSP